MLHAATCKRSIKSFSSYGSAFVRILFSKRSPHSVTATRKWDKSEFQMWPSWTEESGKTNSSSPEPPHSSIVVYSAARHHHPTSRSTSSGKYPQIRKVKLICIALRIYVHRAAPTYSVMIPKNFPDISASIFLI